jgi:hypothetical protein
MFEDTKGVIKNRKSKDKQHNSQKNKQHGVSSSDIE